jgi:hypothetical protein
MESSRIIYFLESDLKALGFLSADIQPTLAVLQLQTAILQLLETLSRE